ncbi:MAG: VCBS repeat-containing protein, partial [Saprospiraceae bacterium]|nr:VCBS repeat-containing protein [Saprospiraceae bacterium]
MNRLTYFLMALCLFSLVTAKAQISFTNQANLLTPAQHYSGVAIAIVDVNGDGLDDIVRLDQGKNLNIQYQTNPGEPFTALVASQTPISGESQWGMCTGDVDNNGYVDVLVGGRYDGVKFVLADQTGASYQTTNLTQPSTFVQGVNFADINNDSFLDAFVCHDDGVARIFGNNGDGTFTYQPMWINLATFPSSDNSGNYGSVWSDVDNDGDVDLYIAHCRQGVNNSADPRRINQLFWNNGDGTYTQDTANVSGLRIGAQSWTADFGDIDNDGDFDCFITNHDVSSQILENDGFGHFTDITAISGIQNEIGGSPIQGVFRDFDNDGYIDIIVAGSDQYLFRNNGNKTFSAVSGLFNNNDMESFAIGDLNGDGFQDIYAGYGQIYTTPSNIPDAMWINDGNDNHFLGLSLRGKQSNRNGVGAKVTLVSALGTQVREVRSGESYGISNSMLIHFGMGQETTIDSVVVDWPSGIRDVIYQPTVDQYLTFAEGGCLVPPILLSQNGSTTICTGQSVEFSAPDGYSYLWSTGDTTQTISATTAGSYNVTVTSTDGCDAISNSLVVTVDPVEIPTISASGEAIFCAGGSVQLSSSPAAAYLWSTGETTQTITATLDGAYTVSAQGLCAFHNSAPFQVTVFAETLPVVTQDTVVAVDSMVVFEAGGSQINWFADETGGQPIASGSPFQIQISAPTSYWVSNTVTHGGGTVNTGMINHQGSNFSDNNYNGGLIFDCFEPFTLISTKVYASLAGDRKIQLKNADGTVIAESIVSISSGTTVIDLGFQVPIGTDYL